MHLLKKLNHIRNYHTFGLRNYILKFSHFFLRLFLINIIKLILPINKKKHDVNISHSFDAPWKYDLKFFNNYKKIKNFTINDHYRLYSIYLYFNQIKKKGGAILDIGCLKGGISFLLSKLDKKNTFFFIDTFFGHTGIEKMDNNYNSNTTLKELKENILKFSIKKYKILKGVFPHDNFKYFNKKIKFAHIDVNSGKYTKKIFYRIEPLIIKGGIIIFDDYGIISCENLTNFLNSIKKKYENRYIFVNNFFGQLILIKKY